MADSSPYSKVDDAVQRIISDRSETHPTVVAYMIARAALLLVRSRHGAHRAAEIAYKLADEFAGEVKK